MKLTEYRGYEVEVSENSGEFQATKDSYSTMWFSTLELLKEKVDKLIKSEFTKGFPIETFQIFRNSYETRIIKGKLTSYNQEDKSIWFSRNDGRREKLTLSYRPNIYLINEVNDILLKQLEEKYSLLTQTEKEVKTITEQLTKWQPVKEVTDE